MSSAGSLGQKVRCWAIDHGQLASLLVDDSANVFYKVIANCSNTELNFVTETGDPNRWGSNVSNTVPVTWTTTDRFIFDIVYRKA